MSKDLRPVGGREGLPRDQNAILVTAIQGLLASSFPLFRAGGLSYHLFRGSSQAEM